ncbi:uncharacterized protein LOC135687681 [Rhopilema esculentum]|uniref:uncharacterized protein LOC135687681 n=1 Tax=Rhopilema esculentum TaxID=499914 RepID=UPI0031E43576
MWKEDFKHVEISRGKGSFTKCGVCVLLKDLTTASTNPDRRKRLVQKKTKHIEQQQSQTQWDYAKQGNLYSSYKHHTTLKALIAVTLNGSACFVSDFYEGSLDDDAITQRCGILDYIGPGDLLLVD